MTVSVHSSSVSRMNQSFRVSFPSPGLLSSIWPPFLHLVYDGYLGRARFWMSAASFMKLVQSFKCPPCNGLSGTGLSFSTNSSFSTARRDPHPPPPCCGNCTLQRQRARTQRLRTAAGKVANFLFHLNNKQAVC